MSSGTSSNFPTQSQQAAYAQRLQNVSDTELESERQDAVSNADITQLNIVMVEFMSRMSSLKATVTQLQQTTQQQAQQSQQQAPTTTVGPATTQNPPGQPGLFIQKTVKIERPGTFNGEPSQLSNFVFMVGQYMDTTGILDPVARQQYAATLLRKRAMTWWRTWCDRIPGLAQTLEYNVFVNELENAFRDVDHIDRLRRRLAGLKQLTSVQRYIDEFRNIIIELGTSQPDADTVKFQFINGLKPVVQLQVRLQDPPNLAAAEQAAQKTDSAVFLASRGGKQVLPRANKNQWRNIDESVPMDLGALQQASASSSRPPITCHRCGKQGHIRRDCRVKLGPNKGSHNGNWRRQQATTAEQQDQLPPPPPPRRQPKNE